MPVITAVLATGTLAARPAASASNTGFLYFASDQNGGTLYQSTGSAWVQIAAAVTQTAGGVGAVANAGGAPSLQVGLDAAKPAAGTAGRLYVATDTTIIYEDSGSAWIEVATSAPLWASVVGKPATFTPSPHEATHLSGGSDAIAREGLLPQVASSIEGLATDPVSPADGRTWLNTALGAIKARIAGATEILNDWNFLRNKPSTFTPATHTHPESDVTSLATDLAARVQLSPGSQQGGAINVSGEVQGSDFKPGGVTGASAAARYHAATATGHPTTGTWQVGDIVPDQTGTFWFCTVAGTPGTWVQVGGTGGAGSSTLAGDTDVAIASPVGGQVLGYSSALSKWVNQNQAGVAATQTSSVLSADATMTSANTYYDVATVSCPPGTWLLLGSMQFSAVTTNGQWEGKIWDGTTVFASGETHNLSGMNPPQLTIAAIVAPTTTTVYKLSGACNGAGNVIKATIPDNASGATNTATYLRAIQLSGNPVGQQAPAVRAYSSINIGTGTGTWSTLTFDSTKYDQGTSIPQHSNSVNISRFTCQQAGTYVITAHAQFAGSAGGVYRLLRFLLNGVTDIGEGSGPVTGGNPTRVTASTQWQLSVGDYIEVQSYQDSGGALNVITDGSDSPEFMMARIDSGSSTVLGVTTTSVDYTIPSVQTMTIVSASGKTMTLPTAVNAGGQACVVKNNGSATATTIATTASQTIDGSSTYSLLAAYASATFISDGSNWYVV